MKTKLQILTAVILFVSLVTASAQPPINSATGATPAIDPATGMPVPVPADPWMDPNWKDPVKLIPAVNFANGLPVSEVMHYLSDQFTNDFDIIVPTSYPMPDGSTMTPGDYNVTLQLRNVTASEIFRAMNLEFEAERMPLQWNLEMNGTRRTAILRVMPELISAPQAKRMVFYIGDMNGMSLDTISDAINRVWQVAGVVPPSLDGHLVVYAPAQLLIINGTQDQIDLAQQTLKALKLKAQNDLQKPVDKTDGTASTPAKSPK